VPIILRNLPYFDTETEVLVRNGEEPVKVRASQIIVWVSITRIGQMDSDPATPRFPALLDTGLSHNFSIPAKHLRDWAGFDLSDLPRLGFSDLHSPRAPDKKPIQIPRHQAEVWLHRNKPGERDVLLNGVPFRLQLDNGIIVYPEGQIAPRLPLFGLRALQWSRLRLLINSERRRVSVRAPFGVSGESELTVTESTASATVA